MKVKMYIKETVFSGKYWFQLAQFQLRELKNTVLNFRATKMQGISWPAERIVASQKGWKNLLSQIVSHL
jgi:hypothetical protein